MERARQSRLSLAGAKSVRANRRIRPREPKKKATVHARRRESDRMADAAAGRPGALVGDRREIVAVLLLAASLVSALALLSWNPETSGNLIGRAGAWLARHLFEIFGLGAFVLPASLFLGFLGLVRPGDRQPGLVVSVAWLAVVALFAVFLELVAPTARFWGVGPAGGLGGAAAELLRRHFSTVGSAILVLAAIAVALVVAAGVKWSRFVLLVGRAIRATGAAIADFVRVQIEQHKAEREARLADEAMAEAEAEAEAEALAAAAFDAALDEVSQPAEGRGRRKGRKREEPSLEADLDGRVVAEPPPEEAPVVVVPPGAGQKDRKKAKGREEAAGAQQPEAAVVPLTIPADPAWAAGPILPAGEKPQAAAPETPTPRATAAAQEPAATAAEPPAPIVERRPEPQPQAVVAEAPPQPPAAEQPPAAAGRSPAASPVIDVPRALPKPKKSDSPFDLITTENGFSLPPVSLLDSGEETRTEIDEALLHATAEKLRQKLADFGIHGHVERIRPGPVVTMYEFAPAPGVKISKIASLSDDLAMALEALRVRIVAPIPGRGVVGIEVPNKKREIVYLRDIIEQDAFRKSKSKLTMALGKDIEGMPFVADLAKMPHLLISGTTGSGKSVSVNSMIMSLLFKATPEEVRFIMVDPKMLELSIYEGIPHLLLPVVTDPRKAALALRWAVDEMERRYALLAENGVRDLASYNKLVAERQKEREERKKRAEEEREPKKDLLIIDLQEGETEEEALARVEAEKRAAFAAGAAAPEASEEEEPELRKLPYLVIIIDELADLMMVASKEVETYIARIAQKARAAGIHLMVATQRPSVDVVTGLIKANFPSRISFLLRSRVDSQTILDQPGAEKLLGMGDMLILPPTSAHIQRVHGALVTEKEIKRVVEHLKAQGSPVYDESILRAPEEEQEDGAMDDDLSDELYDQAVAIVSEMKTVSISMLQRKMRIGYNRSARMIERMEREGIVGPADGAKPREVLIRPVGEMPGA